MILSLTISGAAVCLFLLAVLAAKRPFRTPDASLAAWFGAQAASFLVVAISTGFPAFWPIVLLSAGQIFLFSLGPAQLVYARAMAGQPLGLKNQGVAIGVITGLLLLLPLLVDLDVRSGAIIVEQPPVWLFIVPPAALLASMAWPIAALRIAGRARRRAKDRYSNLGSVDPGWIRIWAISSLAVSAISLLAFLNAFFAFLPLDQYVAAVLGFQILQLVYVAHRGLTRPGVFLATARQVETANIDFDAAKADYERARSQLAETRLFLDPDLTAPRLADELGWGPDRLTRAFRIGGSTNFHDAVLRARLKEMENLARDPANERVTTLALGLDAGFGSKSAMYEAFRRELSTTPAAWRKSVAHI
ncbi:AraC family transcriptional regulator [Hyphobacterium sp. HN65]|uniref:AraC family transcriptional regulator n=1 Tax=Hyphobacterium lacteum TaxID=3116575 RepID=A0ABU7LSQ4_9PROT|nr:AraC family transcriptional regulator [Hyphobacterium sp. HN65]MEE2526953.1 AraC family transcriptional regulator [Hyphobacterium sp. HN65]